VVEKATADKIIEEAVRYVQNGGKAPATGEVVTALAAAEKQSKRLKQQSAQRYDYEQLLGVWRLGFVSGTRKVRPRAGAKAIKKLGNGRFTPRWARFEITYQASDSAVSHGDAQTLDQALSPANPLAQHSAQPLGLIENAVTLGPVSLRLKGPNRFWPNTNSLGFDFTALQAQIGALALYKGAIRGGAKQDELFKAQSLKDHAFFTFFLLQPNYIAARGKGGGLALWVRSVS
jgi:hypothetical protein